jgi:hypothetical protein
MVLAVRAMEYSSVEFIESAEPLSENWAAPPNVSMLNFVHVQYSEIKQCGQSPHSYMRQAILLPGEVRASPLPFV